MLSTDKKILKGGCFSSLFRTMGVFLLFVLGLVSSSLNAQMTVALSNNAITISRAPLLAAEDSGKARMSFVISLIGYGMIRANAPDGNPSVDVRCNLTDLALLGGADSVLVTAATLGQNTPTIDTAFSVSYDAAQGVITFTQIKDIDLGPRPSPLPFNAINYMVDFPVLVTSNSTDAQRSNGASLAVRYNTSNPVFTPQPDAKDGVLIGTNVFTYTLPPNSVVTVSDVVVVSSGTSRVSGNVLLNDIDIEGDTLSIPNPSSDIRGTENNGTLSLTANGEFVYTPDAGFIGEDVFTYVACDDNENRIACDTNTITFDVISAPTQPNNAPVAVNDVNKGRLDSTITGNLLVNDSDPDGNPLTIRTTPISPPNTGVLVINPDGTYTYTPVNGFEGEVSFSYAVCDNGTTPLCDTAEVNIDIIDFGGDISNTVFANDDHIVTKRGEPASGNLLANDRDAEGNNLVLNTTPIVAPSNGTLTLNADGTYTYTPNAEFVGNDHFVYRVCDDAAVQVCDDASVSIAVLSVNNRPDAVNDTFPNVFEDVPVSLCLLCNDTDDKDQIDPSSLSILREPSQGRVELIANTDSVRYIPNTNFTGRDSFVYVVCDSGLPVYCDTASVFLQVLEQNDRPTVTDDTSTVDEDSSVSICVLCNDRDVETPLDTASLTITTNPSNGTVSVNSTTGEITYVPNPDFNGQDSLVYSVCDEASPPLCTEGKVRITVRPVNDAPEAINTNVTVPEDSQENICIDTRDIDQGDVVRATSIVCGPQNGSATINPNSTCLTYIPNPDFNGQDSVCVIVCDQAGACDTGTIQITVSPVNDPVIAVADTFIMELGNNDTIIIDNVLTNDRDGDGNGNNGLLVTTSSIIGPNSGTLSVNPDGTIRYRPNPNFVGVDSFRYTVCEQGVDATCDSTFVTLVIAPERTVDTLEIDVEITKTRNVCLSTSQLPGTVDTSYFICEQSIGTAEIVDDTCITYNAGNVIGEDRVCVVACDQYGLCDTTYVVVNVTELCVMPIAVTPNGDGENDVYEVNCFEEFAQKSLKIYNRWGDQVWDSFGPYNNDFGGIGNFGSLNNKALPTGTYYYLLFKENGGELLQSGFIEVRK